MLGALVGDIVGSCYEGKKCLLDDAGRVIAIRSANGHVEQIKPRALISHISHFTDDTVLTIATADALLHERRFAQKYIDYFVMTSSKTPFYSGHGIGYGAKFLQWADVSNREGVILPPYNSYGNGAAMRVSPVAYVCETAVEVLNLSLESCLCTHNTPSAVKSAQVVALCIWLGRAGWSAQELMEMVKNAFGYDLGFSVDKLIEDYQFDPTAQGSVPVAVYLALSSSSFVEVMQKCLKVGGDTDTIACIAGSIAEPIFGIPDDLASAARQVVERDSPFLWDKYAYFHKKYGTALPAALKPGLLSRVLNTVIRRK